MSTQLQFHVNDIVMFARLELEIPEYIWIRIRLIQIKWKSRM